MEMQLDRDAGADAAAVDGAAWASRCTSASRRPALLGERRGRPACSSRTARRSTATWWSSPPASARTSRWREAAGLDRQARHRRRRRHGDVSDPSICAVGECAEHRGMVYGLVAPLWEQTAVLADRLTGAARGRRLRRLADVDQAEGDGRRPRGDGRQAGRDADDEVVTYAEPGRGVYQKLIVRDGKLAGAILLGDTSRRAGAAAALRPRRRRCPSARASLLFPHGEAPSAALGRRPAGRRPDLQLQRRLEGRDRAARCAAGCRTLQGGLRRDPRRHRLRLVQGAGARRSSRRVAGDDAAGRSRRPTTTCPACRWPSASSSRRSGSMDLRSVSAGVRRAGRRHARIRAARPGSPRCSRRSGATTYVEERDARFINDRVHANIQKDRTYSVVPRIYGGVTTRRRPAPDRRRRRQVRRADGEDHRRPAHRPARHDAASSCPRCGSDLGMPSGHAYTKAFRTCKTCVGSEFCRFGVGDSHGPRHRHREALPGDRVAGQDEARHRRLPAQLLGGDGQGHRRRRHRGRPLGDLRRRRRRRARPQGRPARHRRQRRRRCIRLIGPLHAVVPRERASTSSAPTTSSPRIGIDRVRARHRRRRRGHRGAARRRDAEDASTASSIRGSRRTSRSTRRSSRRCSTPAPRRSRRADERASSATHARPPGEPRAARSHPGRAKAATFAVDGLESRCSARAPARCFATQASCPHPGGPLADGFVGNGKVVCPFHAYRFDLATGCAEGNTCAPLATYPAGVTSDGDVVVTLERGERPWERRCRTR